MFLSKCPNWHGKSNTNQKKRDSEKSQIQVLFFFMSLSRCEFHIHKTHRDECVSQFSGVRGEQNRYADVRKKNCPNTNIAVHGSPFPRNSTISFHLCIFSHISQNSGLKIEVIFSYRIEKKAKHGLHKLFAFLCTLHTHTRQSHFVFPFV